MRWLRRLRPFHAPTAARIGRRGERLAARWFRRRGFHVRARRWRTPAGEVDLLVERGLRLWLVEVKSTAAATGTSPTRRLGAAQRERLRRCARWTAHQRAARGRIVGAVVLGVRLHRKGGGIAFRTVVYDALNRR